MPGLSAVQQPTLTQPLQPPAVVQVSFHTEPSRPSATTVSSPEPCEPMSGPDLKRPPSAVQVLQVTPASMLDAVQMALSRPRATTLIWPALGDTAPGLDENNPPSDVQALQVTPPSVELDIHRAVSSPSAKTVN